jgi:hypothetical protein
VCQFGYEYCDDDPASHHPTHRHNHNHHHHPCHHHPRRDCRQLPSRLLLERRHQQLRLPLNHHNPRLSVRFRLLLERRDLRLLRPVERGHLHQRLLLERRDLRHQQHLHQHHPMPRQRLLERCDLRRQPSLLPSRELLEWCGLCLWWCVVVDLQWKLDLEWSDLRADWWEYELPVGFRLEWNYLYILVVRVFDFVFSELLLEWSAMCVFWVELGQLCLCFWVELEWVWVYWD